jgi:uncharacterized protein YbbC (DUF1343 family)
LGRRQGGTRSGLDVFASDATLRREILRGRRFGLIANPASVTRRLEHAADLLLRCPEGRLAALFGPEHGLTAEAQDMAPVEGRPDARTGLPVHSLYGSQESTLRPSAESLRGIDVLLFDLQDVGSRYYTFAATMGAAMEACRDAGVEFVVLDRPNPLGGIAVEGNLVSDRFRSFVGRYPIPVRHGMTVGELAGLFNERFGIGCPLRVVPLEGWTRELWFDETGLPWVAPSPNMPSLETATVYPGGCLVEGTNLSEGRGTTRPFEWIGAPFLDPHAWSETLEALGLPGVRFRPMRFIPSFHKWGGTSCGGVQVHVVDREVFRPFLTGICAVATARALAPAEFDWRREPYEFVGDRLAIDLLLGGDSIRESIERAGASAFAADPRAIEDSWRGELESFLPLRKASLLYR